MTSEEVLCKELYHMGLNRKTFLHWPGELFMNKDCAALTGPGRPDCCGSDHLGLFHEN